MVVNPRSKRKAIRFSEPRALNGKHFVRVWIPRRLSQGARERAIAQDRYLSEIYAEAIERLLNSQYEQDQ